jgi:NAD(P)-dependent dehydrogenase (short-subunit alcohol dehydrogenase family)
MDMNFEFGAFPSGGVAVVVGAGGGIGGALVALLETAPVFGKVVGFNRAELDIESEASIAAAVAGLAGEEIRLVIDATGFLHGGGLMPEKSFKELSAAHLAKSFAVNALGPALLMKHFLPALPRQGRAVFATLSAKVGSIGDNNIGGWYSYRAAKAALNQLVHTAAIELKRSRPEAVCVALHPGTVVSRLSDPFAKSGLNVRPAAEAAGDLLGVIGKLTPEHTGGFFDYRGDALPW